MPVHAPYCPGVRKSSFPWLLGAILIVAYGGWHLTGLIVTSLGLGVAYLATIRIHPRVRHTGFRSCGGSGEHRGAIFSWRFRKCPRCNGGRLISWGAGHLGAGHIQTEYAKGREARKTAKKNHAWR